MFKNKSKRKRNFIIYHFVVESKLHEGIDLLITASRNIYQKKKGKKSIPIAMKTCFSAGKLMKQFGILPPLSTNPLLLSNFFITPLFVQIFKTRTPPIILGGGEETM